MHAKSPKQLVSSTQQSRFTQSLQIKDGSTLPGTGQSGPVLATASVPGAQASAQAPVWAASVQFESKANVPAAAGTSAMHACKHALGSKALAPASLALGSPLPPLPPLPAPGVRSICRHALAPRSPAIKHDQYDTRITNGLSFERIGEPTQ